MNQERCFGDDKQKKLLAKYHDEEWGIPVHDDQKHFEMIILEGAQAGLSWDLILKKREGYRTCFKNFNPQKISQMTDGELEQLRLDERIIRNRLKIYATRKNAVAFLKIQEEFGSFDAYIWGFVNGNPVYNSPKTRSEIPTTSHKSNKISKDLKKRGMKFVGSTIIYSYMQAVGLVNDHLTQCPCYKKNN